LANGQKQRKSPPGNRNITRQASTQSFKSRSQNERNKKPMARQVFIFKKP
jgi:hypothetical protein